jgi:hypothetical protein
MPELKDGKWVLTKTVVALTAEQIASRDAAKAKEVRIERNKRLAETDWVVVLHTEKGTDVPTEWESYRQALRDLPNHVNFPYLQAADWPTKP